jgi:hypothetical protein
MARYQITYWNGFPSQVKADDGQTSVKAMLSNRFQEAIDAAAMAAGSSDSDSYLEGWMTGDYQDAPGAAQEVLDHVLAELDAAYPPERLQELIRAVKSASRP